MNSRRIVDVDPQSDSRWQAFVASRPDALVFHHPAWLAALEEAYGYRPHHLACENREHEIVGILPLVYKRGLVTGRTFSSLPHSLAAGPLAADAAAATLLVEGAVDRARDRRNARLQLRTWEPGLDSIAPAMAGRPGVGMYVVRLPDSSQELRFGDSRNHGAIKRAVQKAANAGVRIRAAEDDRDLREWYRLYIDTMRTHGAVAHSYRFVDALWQLLRPHGLVELLLAEGPGRDGGLLAGSLFLRWGKSSVFFALNGRRPDALPLRPNDAIHWRAIHDAWRDGVREYNLGGAEGNPGLVRFKRKWGAEPHRLYRYYFPSPRDSTLTLSRLDNPVARMATTTWKHLPTRAVERLGDLLYRYA